MNFHSAIDPSIGIADELFAPITLDDVRKAVKILGAKIVGDD